MNFASREPSIERTYLAESQLRTQSVANYEKPARSVFSDTMRPTCAPVAVVGRSENKRALPG